jgi:hypothetical protein
VRQVFFDNFFFELKVAGANRGISDAFCDLRFSFGSEPDTNRAVTQINRRSKAPDPLKSHATDHR